jgi:hypothetical protein
LSTHPKERALWCAIDASGSRAFIQIKTAYLSQQLHGRIAALRRHRLNHSGNQPDHVVRLRALLSTFSIAIATGGNGAVLLFQFFLDHITGQIRLIKKKKINDWSIS